MHSVTYHLLKNCRGSPTRNLSFRQHRERMCRPPRGFVSCPYNRSSRRTNLGNNGTTPHTNRACGAPQFISSLGVRAIHPTPNRFLPVPQPSSTSLPKERQLLDTADRIFPRS